MKQIFNKYFWREPIYRDDVKNYLLNGFLYAILAGVLAGALDTLFWMINFPLSFGLIIICFMLGSRLSKSYYTYHILYPTLTIPFMLIALLASDLMSTCLIYRNLSDIIRVLGSGEFYLNVFFWPITNLISLIKHFDLVNLLFLILDICIYGWAFVYCFKMVKGRN